MDEIKIEKDTNLREIVKPTNLNILGESNKDKSKVTTTLEVDLINKCREFSIPLNKALFIGALLLLFEKGAVKTLPNCKTLREGDYSIAELGKVQNMYKDTLEELAKLQSERVLLVKFIEDEKNKRRKKK